MRVCVWVGSRVKTSVLLPSVLHRAGSPSICVCLCACVCVSGISQFPPLSLGFPAPFTHMCSWPHAPPIREQRLRRPVGLSHRLTASREQQSVRRGDNQSLQILKIQQDESANNHQHNQRRRHGRVHRHQAQRSLLSLPLTRSRGLNAAVFILSA